MGKDLHKKPFGKETIAKLEIFEDYADAWLPAFVMSGSRRVAIFDFFAGQGYDVDGVPGSSIRILETIKGQIANIKSNGTKVDLHLNEFKKKKYEALRSACLQFLEANPDLTRIINLYYYNEDFDAAFSMLLPMIGGMPSLVYLDQNGIKALSPKYFAELERKPKTDFLYFVSSSYFWRFGESDEFRSHIDFDIAKAKLDPYQFIHRQVIEHIRLSLPSGSNLMLYPYSIRKGTNIHGIIFGSSHYLAVDKFLRIAWKRNEVNGEANFDIDDDASKTQPDLWGQKRLTKLERFEKKVEEEVKSGRITTNADALLYSYSQGHLGSHAAAVLRSMKKQKQISYEGALPLVTYESVLKYKKIIPYTIIKDGQQ